jgi:ribosomal protein L37AE/L43A
MTRTTVGVGDLGVEVGLYLQRFANGGSWSLFRCPSCGRKARVLRLLEGSVVCRRCCIARGVRPRTSPMSVRQRAERRISKLKAMLESERSLRLKPHLWGKLERRSRLETALARAEFIVSRKDRRFRDVQAEELEPEPIARPKIKTPPKTKTTSG